MSLKGPSNASKEAFYWQYWSVFVSKKCTISAVFAFLRPKLKVFLLLSNRFSALSIRNFCPSYVPF